MPCCGAGEVVRKFLAVSTPSFALRDDHGPLPAEADHYIIPELKVNLVLQHCTQVLRQTFALRNLHLRPILCVCICIWIAEFAFI